MICAGSDRLRQMQMKSGAKRRRLGGIWCAGERGGQPLCPLLISVEARLICNSQDLILHAVLSDEVVTVRQPFGEAFRSEPYCLFSPTIRNKLAFLFQTLCADFFSRFLS
jgi:hypothetical protein